MNKEKNQTNAIPFLVYSIDGPVYHHFDGEYGKHRKTIFEGTLVALSGGYLYSNKKDIAKIEIEGCIACPDRIGEIFLEKVFFEMLSHDSRVVILYYTIRDQIKHWLSIMENAGFDIVCDRNSNNEFCGEYAVCIGNVSVLNSIIWTEPLRGFEPFFVLVNRNQESEMERMIIKAIKENTNPVTIARNIISDISLGKKNAESMLGEYEIVSWIIDSHMTSLLINIRRYIPLDIRKLFCDTAKKLNIMLYNAPMFDRKRKRYFTDFDDYEKRILLPPKWNLENK